MKDDKTKPEKTITTEPTKITEEPKSDSWDLAKLLGVLSSRDLDIKDIKSINEARLGMSDTMKMALDTKGQTDKILETLAVEEKPLEPEDSLEDIISTPAGEFTDNEKEKE